MTSFFDLSREIRDIIFEYALYYFHPLPESPEAVAQNRKRLSHCTEEYDECNCEDKDILIGPEEDFGNGARRLFLVNRRIHEETKSLIKRKKRGLSIMDVMVVNERELWPTWLAAPVSFHKVDNVKITFWFFGIRQRQGSEPASEYPSSLD